MVSDQIQNYVNLVAGLRRATKAKASEAAQGLLSATGLDDVAADAGERVSILAEEILAASRANRELLVKMINTEVDKAAAKIGFARAEDLEALRGEVGELRAAMIAQSARAESAAAAKTTATKKAAAKKTATRKTATRKTATKKTATKKTSATKAPAKRAAATKAPAKRGAATRASMGPLETA